MLLEAIFCCLDSCGTTFYKRSERLPILLIQPNLAQTKECINLNFLTVYQRKYLSCNCNIAIERLKILVKNLTPQKL